MKKPETPELDKVQEVRDRSQTIGEFLDWLPSQGIFLARYYEERGLSTFAVNIQELLAEYFDIDLEVMEEEKRRLLSGVSVEQCDEKESARAVNAAFVARVLETEPDAKTERMAELIVSALIEE